MNGAALICNCDVNKPIHIAVMRQIPNPHQGASFPFTRAV